MLPCPGPACGLSSRYPTLNCSYVFGISNSKQVCVDHFETHEFLLEKIPAIAEQICRCALIETLLGASSSSMAKELRQALLKLYTHILAYLARATTYIQKPTKSLSSRSNSVL